MGSLRRGPDAVGAVPLVDLGPTSARSPRLASGLIDNGSYVLHRFATFGSPSVSGHEIRFANWTAAPGKVGIASEAITTSAVETSDRSTAARAGIAQTRGASDLAAAADDEGKRRLELSDPRNWEVDSQWQHRPVVRREAQQSAETHLDEFRARSIATLATRQSGHFGASCQGSSSILQRGAGQCSCAHS